MAKADRWKEEGEDIRKKILEICILPHNEEDLAKKIKISRTKIRQHLHKLELKLDNFPINIEELTINNKKYYQTTKGKETKIKRPDDSEINKEIRKFIKQNKRVPEAIEILSLPQFKNLFIKDTDLQNRFLNHIQVLINTISFLEVSKYAKLNRV